MIDADGQHPAAAIPAFVAAGGDAELVIGDRFGDLCAMPWQRRLANRTTRRLFRLVTGHDVRDTQNGMRLLRGRALELLPPGGYEAETRHLQGALRPGVPVALGAYAGDLRGRAKLVPSRSRLRASAVGTGRPQRTADAVASPISGSERASDQHVRHVVDSQVHA